MNIVLGLGFLVDHGICSFNCVNSLNDFALAVIVYFPLSFLIATAPFLILALSFCILIFVFYISYRTTVMVLLGGLRGLKTCF